ncbi:Endonuclease/exonuclease/phosphatase [Triangularia verruculosa]|uniref:Endonuclease/exonuclease/phosphatase n=1 Tax=Triangularia verruculosa TaxID=2587418 RepID=A0AAN6XL07_9PEZI|nr:Endonuclease/exonuclease/phosphatase [Triangularia verruculosa]
MFNPLQGWRSDPAPFHQGYSAFVDGKWKKFDSPTKTIVDGSNTPTRFSVWSWNIDFKLDVPIARMKAALKHVQSLVASQGDTPCIIMFNEMVASDLELIGDDPWIRQNYNVSDLTGEHWNYPNFPPGFGYGTCILVPKVFPIKAVFRVYYPNSAMQRDALFVDIAIPRDKVLRVCTTHLESLVARPPKRPAQLAAAAKILHQAHAGILAGDLNAIERFDWTLHEDNKLKDAYLETGGKSGDEAGMTWGLMGRSYERERYGLSRMDKVLFCGKTAVLDYGTFGLDVEVEDEVDRQKLMASWGLQKGWVTDHLGVRAEFQIEEVE